MAQQLVAGRASLEVRALSRTVLGWQKKHTWSLKELSEKVGFSTAKLSKANRAVDLWSPADVLKIAAACGAFDDEVELCLSAAQRAVYPQMWDRINGDARTRLTWTAWDVMSEASELVIVAADVLPELVRLDAYHNALLQSGATVNALDLTTQREVLRHFDISVKDAARPGSPPQLSIRLIVSESALSHSVGGVRVMADQLAYLEELSRHPRFVFSVEDREAGPCLGTGTSFTVMRFVERHFDDVVLVRTLHGGDT